MPTGIEVRATPWASARGGNSTHSDGASQGGDADGDLDLTAADGDFGDEDGVGLLEGLGEKRLGPLDVGLPVFYVADMTGYAPFILGRPEAGVA